MSHITRIITTALLAFVSFAPAATATTAAPAWDQKTAPPDVRQWPAYPREIAPSTPATTATTAAPARDHKTAPPEMRQWPAYPREIAPSTPAADVTPPPAVSEDSSPLAFIVGGVIMSLLLAGGLAYTAHGSRRSRRARVTV